MLQGGPVFRGLPRLLQQRTTQLSVCVGLTTSLKGEKPFFWTPPTPPFTGDDAITTPVSTGVRIEFTPQITTPPPKRQFEHSDLGDIVYHRLELS